MAQAIKRRAKLIYVVEWKQHGTESDKWAGRMVLVSKPQNKRERMGGCPICKAEAKVAA